MQAIMRFLTSPSQASPTPRWLPPLQTTTPHQIFCSFTIRCRVRCVSLRTRIASCSKPALITVYDVLSYLAVGMTQQEILADFPYLTEEDILASLGYAAAREQRTLVVQA